MFQANDYVMHNARGVCRVESVTRLDFTGNDKLYYKLIPLFEKDSTVYVPAVDASEGGSVRPVITREEALRLIRMIPEIEARTYANFKEQAQACREILYSGNQREWVSLMKGIFQNGLKRKESGKTLSAGEVESRKAAEAFLYGELSVALDIPLEQVEDYICQEIDG